MEIREEIDFNNPSEERKHALEIEGSGKGRQLFWRFKNGYGASVVQFRLFNIKYGKGGTKKPRVKIDDTNYMSWGNYTKDVNEWELTVIKFNDDMIDVIEKGDLTFSITYDTPITNDVFSKLNENEVVEILKKIKGLKRKHAEKNEDPAG